jgi:uncharacterized membrane protein
MSRPDHQTSPVTEHDQANHGQVNHGQVNHGHADHDHPTHGHHHHHGPVEPASPHLRRLLAFIVAPLVLLTLVGVVALWPSNSARSGNALAGPGAAPPLVDGRVVDVDAAPCRGLDAEAGAPDCMRVSVELLEGPDDGQTVAYERSLTGGQPIPNIGARVRMELIEPVGAEPFYDFYDFQRRTPMLVLATLFIGVAVLVGRMRGLRALIGLAFSLAVIVWFTLPSIVDGNSPLLVALATSALVMVVALYLSHGPNARTTSALIGTLASLTITGLLGYFFLGVAQLTGLVDESSSYLRATAGFLDFRGLLLAGIIIGALGVLDDVTVTQASAVWELHRANPNLGLWGLYRSALRIGQDHIASAVNTLMLAYAGASLPLLLLFSQTGESLGTVATGEILATEIVRTLIGSIGLISSVPITTFLTALVVSGDRVDVREGLGRRAARLSERTEQRRSQRRDLRERVARSTAEPADPWDD